MDHPESNMDGDKMDEMMLPGFRFHPTDEELVGFYLRRKTLQRPLSIELIKQLDIYKYDPWDLPKLATTGEKEWYFYCPRDRKYRNSARPNRVTLGGFWKATGTDRPIYSSESSSSKCIGLKKSLVFYKGRAAKGTKTDWMMHEFRLPSTSNHYSSISTAASTRRPFITKHIPPNDAWAICRIFKKVNSSAQRGISQFWGSTPAAAAAQQPNSSDDPHPNDDTIFSSSDNIINNMMSKSTTSSLIHFGDNYKVLPQSSNMSLLDDLLTYTTNYNQITTQDLSTIYTTFQTNNNPTTTNLLPNSSIFGDFGSIIPQPQPQSQPQPQPLQQQQMISNYNQHACPLLPQDLRRNINLLSTNIQQEHMVLENEWSHHVPPMAGSFALNFPLNFVWDSMPCPSDVSSTFSTNN